jgi:hypothetical protein
MEALLRNRFAGAVAALLIAGAPASAQDVASYRLPPSPIPQILDAEQTPLTSIAPGGMTMALVARPGLPDIAEIAEPELRLAGTRINPRTNGPSRSMSGRSLTFQDLESGTRREVQLPADVRIGSWQWSPDASQLAFTNTVANGVELWVADARTAQARRLLGPELNGTLGAPYEWSPDGRSLLVKRVAPGRGAAPVRPAVPTGPIIQESYTGAAPVRTYQDLLANSYDEALFDYYFTSQLVRIPAAGGTPTPVGEPGIISGFSPSPNGEYILFSRIKRPYSYIAPMFAFGNETFITDAGGRRVHSIIDRSEVTMSPIGRDMVNPGPRSVNWPAKKRVSSSGAVSAGPSVAGLLR